MYYEGSVEDKFNGEGFELGRLNGVKGGISGGRNG